LSGKNISPFFDMAVVKLDESRQYDDKRGLWQIADVLVGEIVENASEKSVAEKL
jgi:hypothetical protein